MPASSTSTVPSISYIQGHQLLGAEVNGDLQFWLTDALGTVRDVVDDSGNVIRAQEFDELGNLISSTGSGTFAPKTYQGALSVNDDRNDSGLYLMGHRHFDSTIGRFISRDPIGFAGGLHLYNGAGASPVTFTDPAGLDEEGPSDHPNEILYQEMKAHGREYLEAQGPYFADQFDWIDGIAGYGDSYSFGATRLIRRVQGTDCFVNESSSAYRVGDRAALVGSLGRLGYALLAKGIPFAARRICQDSVDDAARLAVKMRNAMKIGFRGPAQIGGRLHGYEKLLTKYGGDSARVLQAAGRTGKMENAFGVWGVLGNAASRASHD